MRRRLQLQILIPFLCMIILATGLLSYIGYYNATALVVDNQTEGNETVMGLISYNLDQYLVEQERLVNMLAGNNQIENTVGNGLASEAGQGTSSAAEEILHKAMKANDQLLDVYIGFANKDMLITSDDELPEGFDPTSRDWYKKAISQPDQPVWVDPYTDALTNTLVLTVSRAVMVDGKAVGVLGVDLKVDALVKMLNDTKLGETGHVFLLDAENHMIFQNENSNMALPDLSEAIYKDQMQQKSKGSLHVKVQGDQRVVSYVINDKFGWKIVGIVSNSEFKQKAAAIVMPSLISLLLVVLVAALLSWLLARAIVRPIRKLQAGLMEFQQGNLSVRSGITQQNEIGKLALAFDEMVEQMGVLMGHIRNTAGQLAASSQMLKVTTEENTAASNVVAGAMQEICTGAADQASIVEQNATIVHEMASQIVTVEMHTEHMSTKAHSMMDVAVLNGERMEQLSVHTKESVSSTASVTKAMYSLGESSRQIGEFVSVIASITNQTNILSLNAAIEAARAGEQGRGFGVVAEEIRKLAAQSQAALLDISNLVKRIDEDTRQAVQLTEAAGAAITEQQHVVVETQSSFQFIYEAVQSNLEGIDQVAAAVKLLTNGKDLISTNTLNLQSISESTAAGTEEVSASIEEQTASMEELNLMALKLEEVAAALSREVNKFN